MIFFSIWTKNSVSFSRYLSFCIFVCVIISSCIYHKKLHLCYFFWILSTIKMKFCQILVCCVANISNVFLAECWRLETSCRLFHDFIKMTIQENLTIFGGWHLPFLNGPDSLFFKKKKRKHWNLDIIWLFSNWG